jgi:hypothetical protein
MRTVSDIRPSSIAGTWYTGDPIKLSKQVDAYLEQAKVSEFEADVVAVISPHAGHVYSGRTAGYAFRAVKGREVDLVVVVSPMHSFHPAMLLTSAHRAYATPLGEIEVDQIALASLVEALRENAGLELTAVIRDSEHSLEIQLPFLQRALIGKFKLLPVMVRGQSQQVAHQLGLNLAQVLGNRSVLLVASTDLSHFYPESLANELDGEMLRQIEQFSPEGVLNAELTGTGFACGAYAVAAVLWAARQLGANAVQVLHHSTSADQTGNSSEVVGYGAAVVLRRA